MDLHEIETRITEHTYPHTYSWFSYRDNREVTSTYERECTWGELWHAEPHDFTVPGVGHVSVVESFGGEGKGDEAWVVILVVDEAGRTHWYRKDGWYASYSGVDFDGEFREVRPTTKTVVVYA